MDSDQYLDGLFQKARRDTTEMTFEEASANLLKTTVSIQGWDSFLTSLKSIFVAVGIVSVGTFIWLTARPDVPFEEKDAFQRLSIETDVAQIRDQLTVIEFPQATTRLSVIKAEKPVKSIENEPVEEQTRTSGVTQAFTPFLVPQPLSNGSDLSPISPARYARPLAAEVTTKVPILTPVTFQINESSSTKTLASISAMAERAGIDYTYVVDLKKNLIREFNVEMFIRGTDKATTIQVNVPAEGRFEIELGWNLDGNGKAIELSREVLVERDRAKHPLTQTLARNLYRIYLSKGIPFLQANFDQLSAGFKPKRSRDRLLNMTGYYFLHEDRLTEAIEIFSLNCDLFPGKPNTWDSLGEAFYRAGRKEEALQAFRKALEIKPNFPSAKGWVRQILSEK